MAAKYKYNPRTLQYEKVKVTFKQKFFRALAFVSLALVFAITLTLISYEFINSPKEKHLKRENAQLQTQYKLLDKRVEQLSAVLKDIENRDDNIYRVIFEAEPIPKEIRQAGFGGSWERYKELEGFDNSKLVVTSSKKIDKLSKQMYIQSRSFDEVLKMAKKKEKMLACIPAIQPVSNSDLTRMASGYGYRIDPHYKVQKFHAGMDFTAPRGTPIYATGDGVVSRADSESSGYGKHVRINHGYGYETLYAHMSKMLVVPGQKIKRGDIIGLVGNTGKSVGPHCHYEVRKNGNPVNPINFYFNDLTAEEYDMLIKLSSAPSQSFD